MNYHTTLASGAVALLSLASTPFVAEEAPPTYKADPSVYKLIYEDDHFRVIDGLRKKVSMTNCTSNLVIPFDPISS